MNMGRNRLIGNPRCKVELWAREKYNNEVIGRKKDGDEWYKPIRSLFRSYRVTMKWKNGRIVKKFL